MSYIFIDGKERFFVSEKSLPLFEDFSGKTVSNILPLIEIKLKEFRKNEPFISVSSIPPTSKICFSPEANVNVSKKNIESSWWSNSEYSQYRNLVEFKKLLRSQNSTSIVVVGGGQGYSEIVDQRIETAQISMDSASESSENYYKLFQEAYNQLTFALRDANAERVFTVDMISKLRDFQKFQGFYLDIPFTFYCIEEIEEKFLSFSRNPPNKSEIVSRVIQAISTAKQYHEQYIREEVKKFWAESNIEEYKSMARKYDPVKYQTTVVPVYQEYASPAFCIFAEEKYRR